MSKPKLTPLFPMSVKPARRGVYQFKYGTGFVRYSMWDGVAWRMTRSEIKNAPRSVEYSYDAGNGMAIGWRGLAEPPK